MKNDTTTYPFSIRFTPAESKMLLELSKYFGVNKSNTLRLIIKRSYRDEGLSGKDLVDPKEQGTYANQNEVK